MSSLNFPLSPSETLKYEGFAADVTKILNNLIESHKNQAKRSCFAQNSENHEKFLLCLNDKFKSIEVYTQSFHLKWGFENLAYQNCLQKDAASLNPEICLRDMETRCYKHLKDFQNII